MSKRIFAFLSLSAMVMAMLARNGWTPDSELHDGYFTRYVNQPDDYSGKVRCTIIRKLAKCDCCHRAVLYVHGFNDYFFQKEMGDMFVDSCYNFYAVDLRKYGRSLMPGQRPFEVRDLKEYFPDINAAMQQIIEDGNKEIVLMGHSTGGLITAYYLALGQGKKFPIEALILNSPFLDMNLNKMQEDVLVPLVSMVSGVAKNIDISQGKSDAYSQSLLKKYHGEWDYNTKWKMEISPAVTSGWIGAIHSAQRYLQKGTNINIPILLMYSDKSVYGSSWTPDFNKGDAVLNVHDIAKYGKKLGPNVTQFQVKDGLHDLFLSSKGVRAALYKSMFGWLDSLPHK